MQKVKVHSKELIFSARFNVSKEQPLEKRKKKEKRRKGKKSKITHQYRHMT